MKSGLASISIVALMAFLPVADWAKEKPEDYPIRFVVAGSVYNPDSGCNLTLESDGKRWFVHDYGTVHCHTFPRGTVLRGKFAHMSILPSIFILTKQDDGEYKVFKYKILEQNE